MSTIRFDALTVDGLLTVGSLPGAAWVPVDNSGAGLAFAAVSGVYRRIADLIIAQLSITYPVTASGLAASFSGLPVALGAGAANQTGILSYSDAPTLKYLLPSAGSAIVALADASGSAITNATMSGKTVKGIIVYRV